MSLLNGVREEPTSEAMSAMLLKDCLMMSVEEEEEQEFQVVASSPEEDDEIHHTTSSSSSSDAGTVPVPFTICPPLQTFEDLVEMDFQGFSAMSLTSGTSPMVESTFIYSGTTPTASRPPAAVSAMVTATLQESSTTPVLAPPNLIEPIPHSSSEMEQNIDTSLPSSSSKLVEEETSSTTASPHNNGPTSSLPKVRFPSQAEWLKEKALKKAARRNISVDLTHQPIVVHGYPIPKTLWARAVMTFNKEGVRRCAKSLFDGLFSNEEVKEETLSGRAGRGMLDPVRQKAIEGAVAWIRNNLKDGVDPYSYSEETMGVLSEDDLTTIRSKIFIERRNERKYNLRRQNAKSLLELSNSSTNVVSTFKAEKNDSDEGRYLESIGILLSPDPGTLLQNNDDYEEEGQPSKRPKGEKY